VTANQLDDDVEGVDQLGEAAGRLSMALGRLNRVLRRGQPAGLGPGTISALATVVRCGPIRLGDLAAREQIAPPTLTRIVAGLEESGYVLRSPDPKDGRATRVEATPAAHEVISGAGSTRVGLLRTRLDALSQADLDALLAAVPILEALASDEA
jgi:DNA-binding MarR family transcriptional regulator